MSSILFQKKKKRNELENSAYNSNITATIEILFVDQKKNLFCSNKDEIMSYIYNMHIHGSSPKTFFSLFFILLCSFLLPI